MTNSSVMSLLVSAYHARWHQIVGVPHWESMFNIQAKADPASDAPLSKLTRARVSLHNTDEHRNTDQGEMPEPQMGPQTQTGTDQTELPALIRAMGDNRR